MRPDFKRIKVGPPLFGGHHAHHAGDHGHGHGHGHSHGVVDPTIASTAEGLRAVKLSFALLMLTALLQTAAVVATGSMALLADTIHNFADAATAIPLGIAFVLVRRRPSRRFTYGLGKVEDVAGLMVVLIILFSALASGYESVMRLLYPQPVQALPIVVIAGVVGLLGNAAAALVRIRTGRRIHSTALIADGYHAAADGLTSLAVVAGALGVSWGFPLADPIVGLIITVMILAIVWQAGRSVLTRLIDGIEPELIQAIEHAVHHEPLVKQISEIKARWLGHRLLADITIALDAGMSLPQAMALSSALQEKVQSHLPMHVEVQVRFVAG